MIGGKEKNSSPGKTVGQHLTDSSTVGRQFTDSWQTTFYVDFSDFFSSLLPQSNLALTADTN